MRSWATLSTSQSLTFAIKKLQHATSILFILLGDCLSLRTLTRLVIAIICLWQPQNGDSLLYGWLSACSPSPVLTRVLCWLLQASLHSVHLSNRILEASIIIHDPEPSNMFYFVQEAFCITYKKKKKTTVRYSVVSGPWSPSHQD